jgi:3-hydroxybutyryl-CoA dehydratase
MDWHKNFEALSIGEELTPLIKKITQDKINTYVGAAEDYNPIHVDIEFAKKTPFKGTIAPGYQYMAYISELMAREFGEGWYIGGTLDVRLLKVVRPDDWLITRAKIVDKKKEENGNKIVVCEVRITNQSNEEVIIGQTAALCK